MTSEAISQAMQRVRSVVARRPAVGLHADAPAIARWDRDLSVTTSHANGMQVTTDMPVELGGGGRCFTPGWLLRAGLASCLATRVAMEAAAEGIALTYLEVTAVSTSDIRGVLGMTDDTGSRVAAAPQEVKLAVRARAANVPPERLRALIESSYHCSPVSAAVETAVPVGLHIEIESG